MCPPSTGKAINLFFSTSPKILSLRFSLALVHRGRVLGIIALNLASLPPPGLLASSWVSWRICHVDILFSLFFLYPVHEWNLLLCLQNRPQSFQVGRCNLCGVAFPPCLAWDTSSLRDGEPTQPCQAHHLVWEYLTLFQASVCSFVPFKHACHVAPSQLHCSICPSRGDKVLALWHERAQQANCPSAAGRDLLVPGDPHHLLFSHSACPTLCDPMDCSMSGSSVLHYLLKFAQIHVHWVGDAIQPSCPLSSPSPPAFPSIKVFSNEPSLHIRWPKYWSFSFSISISPSNECSGLISLRIDSELKWTGMGEFNSDDHYIYCKSTIPQ